MTDISWWQAVRCPECNQLVPYAESRSMRLSALADMLATHIIVRHMPFYPRVCWCGFRHATHAAFAAHLREVLLSGETLVEHFVANVIAREF